MYRSRVEEQLGLRLNTEPVTAPRFVDSEDVGGVVYYSVTSLLAHGETVTMESEAARLRVVRGAFRFLRGDCDGDGRAGLVDAVFALEFLFRGGRPPPCAEACETDGDATLTVSDAVRLLDFLFRGTEAPGRFPECELGTIDCLEACAP